MSRILIIEDEESIAELEKDYLELSGFEVEIESKGDVGLKRALEEEFDLYILDLMLPGMDGFEICKEIRNHKNTPILMVSAKKDDIDKIRGLGLGADDYIVKPFSPREVVARIKAVLRRTTEQQQTSDDGCVTYEGLVIDIKSYTVTLRGQPVICTPKEIEILYMLASNPGQVFTREQLLNRVWGYDFAGETRTVDTHIKRLRAKLDSAGLGWSIKTIYGVGYKFEVE